MSNFYFSWKSCMKPWIIHKLGNFAWENCYRDITDVVVVQVIAAARITPVDEHGFGGTALVHDNEMKLTCNFTEQAIREFELKEESTSGCEFNSDLKNALVALRRYRIVPTFTSNEGDSIFTVVVYSFTLKSFTKPSAGIKDTRVAHKHYRIAKKLKELWSQWKNDRLAFVSDDSDSGSATAEVTLSQMIQFMEEAEKNEAQKGDHSGEEKERGRRILGKSKDAVEESGQGTKGNGTKETHDKSRKKENRFETSKERTSDIKYPEAGGRTSASRDKIHERFHAKTDHSTKVNQQTAGASFEIPLSLLDKLRCSQHEKCLHLQPSSPGSSSEAGGETSSHSLNELLESIPVVCYTYIPDGAKQGLPEGLTPMDLDVPWDQEETSNQREEEAPRYTATSLPSVRSCDSSQEASQSREVLQWPPGSSSSQSLQPSVEDRSVASLEASNKASEHMDGNEGGGEVSPAVEMSGDRTSDQSEVQNGGNSKTVINVNVEVLNTKDSAVLMKESQTEGENVTTDEASPETGEIMATQPFVIDEDQPSSKDPSNEMNLIVNENSENVISETQPFDITVSTQRSPGNKNGEPGDLTDGDKTETASQEFEPVATESEEILSNEHNKAFLETQAPADSLKPGTQDPLTAGETDVVKNTDQNASKQSAEADGTQIPSSEIGISGACENAYNSDNSLEDIFELNLTCASPLVGLESQSERLRGNLLKSSNSLVVPSSGGQVIPSCSDIPVRDSKQERVKSSSKKGSFHEAGRKSDSSRNSKKSEVNSSRTDHKQDSDIPRSSHVSASNSKDEDDIDWSWIFNSPANTQKLDELLGESVSSLEEPNDNSRETSKAVQSNSRKSVVNEFLEELQTLQCSCGENLSDSCDSSVGFCQSSCQKDGHELNRSERQSTDRRVTTEKQSKAGQSLQEINLSGPVSDLVGAFAATSDRRRLTENSSSLSRKVQKRKYRKMTAEELSIPKKKLIEDRLLKWITLNYAPKKSKQK